MTSYTTGAVSLVEPELNVVGVYKIHASGQSGNPLFYRGASPHSPQIYNQTFRIDAYLSLLEEQPAQHTQRLQKKGQKVASI